MVSEVKGCRSLSPPSSVCVPGGLLTPHGFLTAALEIRGGCASVSSFLFDQLDRLEALSPGPQRQHPRAWRPRGQEPARLLGPLEKEQPKVDQRSHPSEHHAHNGRDKKRAE